MNRYFRGVIDGTIGIIKSNINNVLHMKKVNISFPCFTSISSELTIEKGAVVSIGKRFRMRSSSRIRVRNGAHLFIGNNISLNHGCFIVCRDSITIGNDTQFGPNVLIYDHDHDFRATGGLNAKQFKSSPIKIGNNVWIGADTVILRGTEIGDNSVVGAGSVLKGIFPADSVIVQKRTTKIEALK